MKPEDMEKLIVAIWCVCPSRMTRVDLKTLSYMPHGR